MFFTIDPPDILSISGATKAFLIPPTSPCELQHLSTCIYRTYLCITKNNEKPVSIATQTDKNFKDRITIHLWLFLYLIVTPLFELSPTKLDYCSTCTLRTKFTS